MAKQPSIPLDDLALSIQRGGRAQLPELLRRIDRWAWKTALRYAPLCHRYGGVDLDDLHQAALIGAMAAVDGYSLEQGSFLHWAAYFMRREIRAALGIRSSKERAEYHCQSMDAPLTEDGVTLADLLPDPEAVPLPDYVATQDALRRIRQTVADTGADVVEAVLFQGRTRAELAQERGVKYEAVRRAYDRQMRQVRHSRELRLLRREYAIDRETPWYLHKGAQAAQWESSTERVAIIRERLREGL